MCAYVCVCDMGGQTESLKKCKTPRLHWVFIAVAKQQYFTWNLVLFIYSSATQRRTKWFWQIVGNCPYCWTGSLASKKHGSICFFFVAVIISERERYMWLSCWVVIHTLAASSWCLRVLCRLLKAGSRSFEINKLRREADQCEIKERIERTERVLRTFLRCLWNNGGYIPSHSTSCFIGSACHSFFFLLSFTFPAC